MAVKKNAYPLGDVLKVKERRVENAEAVLKEKQEALDREQKKLQEKEAERDKTKKHYQDKLEQIRFELDHGTTSDKIQQMKRYITLVQEELHAKQAAVEEQKKVVLKAEEARNSAKQELILRRRDVDKILEHRKVWEKEERKNLEIEEGREQDELGNTVYVFKQRRREEMGI